MYLDNVAKYKESQQVFQPSRDSKPNALLVDLLAKERVGVQPTIGMMNMMQDQTLREHANEPEARVYAAGAA